MEKKVCLILKKERGWKIVMKNEMTVYDITKKLTNISRPQGKKVNENVQKNVQYDNFNI